MPKTRAIQKKKSDIQECLLTLLETLQTGRSPVPTSPSHHTPDPNWWMP